VFAGFLLASLVIFGGQVCSAAAAEFRGETGELCSRFVLDADIIRHRLECCWRQANKSEVLSVTGVRNFQMKPRADNLVPHDHLFKD
jgi:hypothetical protein